MLNVVYFPKDNLFNVFMSDLNWRLKVSLFVCFFSSLFNEFHIMGPLNCNDCLPSSVLILFISNCAPISQRLSSNTVLMSYSTFGVKCYFVHFSCNFPFIDVTTVLPVDCC